MAPRLFAVLGDPVDHSLSPAMQNAALRAANIAGCYTALRVASADLPQRVEMLRRDGFGGFNVTVPHKEAILPLLDGLAPSAADVEAVNTVVAEDGRFVGHNTDCAAFGAVLRSAGYDAAGLTALVFGTGGAARAVVVALLRQRALVVVVSRRREKAGRLAAQFGSGISGIAASDLDSAGPILKADVVVNATPLGMSHLPHLSPLPATVDLCSTSLCVDLVYGRETPFLAHARRRGCRAMDGLEMLLYQGSESFRLWTGIVPDLVVMREACTRRLEEVPSC